MNNILTIRGEKREAREEVEEGYWYHVWEPWHGSFRRDFTLPSSVQADAIHADFDAGILTVRMPNAPQGEKLRHRDRQGEEVGRGEKKKQWEANEGRSDVGARLGPSPYVRVSAHPGLGSTRRATRSNREGPPL